MNTSAQWSSSFERDTLVVAVGELARRLLSAALRDPTTQRRYRKSRETRLLASYGGTPWRDASIALIGVQGIDKFVVHVEHETFELVAQVAYAVKNDAFEALRMANFTGDPASALVWCRAMTSRPNEGKSPSTAPHSIPASR